MRQDRLIKPTFRDNRWWANTPKPKPFKTRTAALDALIAYRRETKCLYHGCWKEGTDDLGLGKGFRFCPRHARLAHAILNLRTT